ncbi:MAG: hypothetical protein IPO06_15105 [Leptospiraceae bacterium]|nr:hypothetical protein [Leptospiraceae bacterium]MBK7057588.1 hypothetical protein [Leptospiraceae bacterium]MBK9500671.1 hypothetical protein [Leptospiraceae bacterium]MBP9888569.1 hypothetical protein [Leptospiraceae bacterium]
MKTLKDICSYKIFRLATLLFSFCGYSIFADTLALKNGQVIENVKVSIVAGFFDIAYEDGARKKIAKKFVKSLKFKIVQWKDVLSNQDNYELERLRIAEFLLQNSNWQPKEAEKPQIMILKFKAGKGITSAKAESLSNLIRTKIINTGLFVVPDRLSVEKELEKNKCNTVSCSSQIAAQLKVNKLLSGEISFAANKYYIVGEVIDIAKKKVDFSETIIISGEEKEEDRVENFSRKIAGGTLEQWEHPIQNPQAGSPPITPYVWRSILFPGWGQFEKEHYVRAFIYPILLIAAGIQYQSALGQYQNNKRNYDALVQLSFLDQSRSYSPYYLYFSEIQKNVMNEDIEKVNRIAAFLAGVYILNLIDVIFTPIPMELKNISVQYNQEIFRDSTQLGKVYGISYTSSF